MKILIVVVVLRTNNVGEYFEGPKRCQIAMDCKSFGWKSDLQRIPQSTSLSQETTVGQKVKQIAVQRELHRQTV